MTCPATDRTVAHVIGMEVSIAIIVYPLMAVSYSGLD
jgi:hypothetical protein